MILSAHEHPLWVAVAPVIFYVLPGETLLVSFLTQVVQIKSIILSYVISIMSFFFSGLGIIR